MHINHIRVLTTLAAILSVAALSDYGFRLSRRTATKGINSLQRRWTTFRGDDPGAGRRGRQLLGI